MYNIKIRYYDELNFFLPRFQKDRELVMEFTGRRSVKDLVESMGVPHVEVDLVFVNGISVSFSYIVNDGDMIEVYPADQFHGMEGVNRLIPSPQKDTGFVLDVHLRRLAKYMRLMGFDTDYAAYRDDEELAWISSRENRILLTCDRQLLMRKIVSRGIIIRSRDPEVQITEVIGRLHLDEMINPFTRCIKCNGIIKSADISSPEFAAERLAVPEGIMLWCREFFRCSSCRKIYWRGSHYDRLSLKLESVLKSLKDNTTSLR